MSVLLRIVAAADGSPSDAVGHYVKRYTPHGYRGGGRLELTRDPEHARHYPDAGAALAEWKLTSATHPTRPDGKPNRPMTAYTVELVTIK